MSRPWTKKWFDDCDLWWGRYLDGRYRHWCWTDWLKIPIDETVPEFFMLCECFNCKCGFRMEPKCYPWGRQIIEMHDDIWVCPKRRVWNFWKHTSINLVFDYIPVRRQL